MLTNARLKLKLQQLDNKCSTLMADYMTEQGVDFQLVPTGQHRHNAAEQAV